MNATSLNFTQVLSASCPVSIVHDNCTVWMGTIGQWHMQTIGSAIICYAAVLANLFNLLIFHYWRNKEPYVFFHVSLAVNSLLTGVLGSLAPIARVIDWTHPTRWPFKVSLGSVLLFQFSSIVNVAAISIDRWFSVEFAVQYRNYATRGKIFLVIFFVFAFSILHTIPPLFLFRDCISLFCSRQPGFRWQGLSYVIWNLSRGPLFLLLILLTQFRICSIAIRAKFRLLRNRRVRALGASTTSTNSAKVEAARKNRERRREARLVMKTVLDSVLPGSLVVVGALVSNLPYYIVEILGLGETGSPAVMFTVFLFACQHIQAPFIYMTFFRQYRKAVLKLCGMTGPGDGRVETIKASGTRRIATNIGSSLGDSAL